MNKKIKSVKMFRYDHSGTKDINPEEKGYRYSLTEHDEKGNVVLEVKYNSDEELEDKYTFKYDENDHVIEEIHYLTFKDIAEHKTYERDKKGKIVKAFKHYNDGSKDTIEYHFNDDGLLMEMVTIDSYDEVEAKIICEYENGNLILEEAYEYDELILKQTYSYDKDGNVIEESKWNEDEGNIRQANVYDENNRVIKVLFYNKKDELAVKTEYEYSKEGKIIGVTEEDQHGKKVTTVTYDDKGNAVEQVEVNPAGEINNKAVRQFNENNDVIKTEVFIDLHGAGPNQEYVLSYEYEYYD